MHMAPQAIRTVVVPVGVTVLLGLRNPPRSWTDPHHGQLTSRWMEDQHSIITQAKTQHHKDGKTCTTLMTAWLSITNQV
jgi:hypothetical protein